MKSWLSLTAAALLAASLAPAALADGEGLIMFGSVAANSTGNNIILDLGGRPLEPGSRVELRQTYVKVSGNRTNLTMYVPIDDPEVAPTIAQRNPTVLSFPIGTGDLAHSPGVFSVHLSSTNYNVGGNRVENGTNYFVVVFDPTDKYFRMSTNFCVRSGSTGINHYPTFRNWAAIDDQDPENPAVIVPLDATDTDGDGLSDVFEAEIGTDPENPDTDGDGFSDQFEYAHYMDPLSKYEPDFRLTTEYIAEGNLEGTLYDLTWNSGVGLTYSVDYSTVLPSGEQSGVWSNVLTTNATANFTIYNVNEFIENPDGSPTGFFRLWYQNDADDGNSNGD